MFKRSTLIAIYWFGTLSYVFIPAILFLICYIVKFKPHNPKLIIDSCLIGFICCLIVGAIGWATGCFSKNNKNLY